MKSFVGIAIIVFLAFSVSAQIDIGNKEGKNSRIKINTQGYVDALAVLAKGGGPKDVMGMADKKYDPQKDHKLWASYYSGLIKGFYGFGVIKDGPKFARMIIETYNKLVPSIKEGKSGEAAYQLGYQITMAQGEYNAKNDKHYPKELIMDAVDALLISQHGLSLYDNEIMKGFKNGVGNCMADLQKNSK